MMAPMVHGLEAQYSGKIRFTYLDADDTRTRGFQKALGFSYQPEFYLLDGRGMVLKKWVGYVEAEQFASEFTKQLQ
jgi:thioredoxin-related protein